MSLKYYTKAAQDVRTALPKVPSLSGLVRFATLAANAHNTQPWTFRIGENTVGILPDFSRRTLVVDPDDHHLYASLGCAIENLVIAANARGKSADVQVREDTSEGFLSASPSRKGRCPMFRCARPFPGASHHGRSMTESRCAPMKLTP